MCYLDVLPFFLLSLSWILNLVESHCILLSFLLGLSCTDSISKAEVIVISVPEMISPSGGMHLTISNHLKVSTENQLFRLFIVARDSREYFISTHHKPVLFWPHKKPKWVLCRRFPFFWESFLSFFSGCFWPRELTQPSTAQLGSTWDRADSMPWYRKHHEAHDQMFRDFCSTSAGTGI